MSADPRFGRTVVLTLTDPAGNTDALLGDRTLQNGQVRPETRDFDVHLTTLAWEQAFLNDNMSLEVRVPFADRVSSDLDLIGSRRLQDDQARVDFVEPTPGSTLGGSDTQLQDVQLILKALLLQSDRYAFTAGLASTLPTADDTSVLVRDAFDDTRNERFGTGDSSGSIADVIRDRRFTIENETFALSPFLALSGAPTGRTFFNAFTQVDFALGQDSVTYEQTNLNLNAAAGNRSPDPALNGQSDPVVTGSRDTAELYDQILLHLDLGGGYWLYRNPRRRRGVTGFALLGEVHYTTTLQDADTVAFQSNFGEFPVTTTPRGPTGFPRGSPGRGRQHGQPAGLPERHGRCGGGAGRAGHAVGGGRPAAAERLRQAVRCRAAGPVQPVPRRLGRAVGERRAVTAGRS